MVGPENESDISICDVNTRGLIDTGSMVSSILQSFYESINPKPELRNIKLQQPTVKKFFILAIF